MPAFIVATVNITDPERFQLYVQGIADLSEKHGGESIVRGHVQETLVGDCVDGERVIVSRFPTADHVRGYIHSAEYQAAAQHRIGAADVTMRLLVVPD